MRSTRRLRRQRDLLLRSSTCTTASLATQHKNVFMNIPIEFEQIRVRSRAPTEKQRSHVGRVLLFSRVAQNYSGRRRDGRWRHVTRRGLHVLQVPIPIPTGLPPNVLVIPQHHRTTSRRPRRQCLQVAPPEVTQRPRLLSFYCNIIP